MKKTKQITFDKDTSLALKGIAVIMLLFHHAFRMPDYYAGHILSFTPFTEQQINRLADSFKICVAVFAFISGYGLYFCYQRNYCNKKSVTSWIAKRYIKSFSGYWLIWILSAVIFQMINMRTSKTMLTDGAYAGVVYGMIDLLGLAKMFDTPTLNGSWWYMSAAFTFILITPIIYQFRDNLLSVLLIYMLFLRLIFGKSGGNIYPGNNSIYPFLVSYILGSIFARYDILSRWVKVGTNTKMMKLYKCVTEVWIIILGYKFFHNIARDKFWEYHYGFFAVIVIVFSIEFLLSNHVINYIFWLLGKYSMNIFLTHSFLRVYLYDFLYGKKHFMLIMLIFLVLSVVLAITIDVLKRVIRYDKLVDRLLAKVDCI